MPAQGDDLNIPIEGLTHVPAFADARVSYLNRQRTLIVCLDGTGDQFDEDNSNIVEFFTHLKKGDRKSQMVYYQAGIGTYTKPQIVTPIMTKISKTLDMMVAQNLSSHVMQAYEFLMQNYEAGDKICIFGFSRGAYTAQALCGMIHKVGLLPACNHQQVPFAYAMFARTDKKGWEQSNAFKVAFSVDVAVEFLGVFDTVNSVGLIPKRLPFTTSNTSVKTFRHALALDEHRVKFIQNQWNEPSAEDQAKGVHYSEVHTQPPGQSARPDPWLDSVSRSLFNSSALESFESLKKRATWEGGYGLGEYEKSYLDKNKKTDVLEVWFAGAHCDVGGGSVENDRPHALAKIPLRWMIRQCFLANTGILISVEGLRMMGIEPTTIFPKVLPRRKLVYDNDPLAYAEPGAVHVQNRNFADAAIDGRVDEEEEDYKDCKERVYDQLEIAPHWWVLEYLPLRYKYQDVDGNWHTTFWPNCGRARVVPKQKSRAMNVHRSVKMRMMLVKDYQPRAALNNVEWAD